MVERISDAVTMSDIPFVCFNLQSISAHSTQNTGWENFQQNCHVILFTLRQSWEFVFMSVCLCDYHSAGNELVFLGHLAASPRLFCGFSQFLPFSLGMHWWETLTRKLYEIHIFSCADVSSKWLPIWSFILKNVDFKKHAIKLNLLIWENKSLPLLPVWMFYSSMNCKMTKFRKLSRGGIYWTETFLTQNIHGSNIS